MNRKIIILLILAFLSVSAGMQLSLHAGATSWSEPTPDRPALDVPYVPTPQEVVDQMLKLGGVKSSDTLIDLGCGDGRTVVTAAKERKVRKAIGVDLDPKRIQESNENARKAGVADRVTFLQKNLFDMDIRKATVMTLYLLPSVNLKLRPKLLRDLKPGSRVVSHDFDMGSWEPDQKVEFSGHVVYYWVIPANVTGIWKWNEQSGNKLHRCELQFEQRFQKINAARLRVDGVEKAVTHIRLSGSNLQFSADKVRFSGTVHGDAIQGSISSHNPGNKMWTARRDRKTKVPIDTTEDSVALVGYRN